MYSRLLQPEHFHQIANVQRTLVSLFILTVACGMSSNVYLFLFLVFSFIISLRSPLPHADDAPITDSIFGYERYRSDQAKGYVHLETTQHRIVPTPDPPPSTPPVTSGPFYYPETTRSAPSSAPFVHPLGSGPSITTVRSRQPPEMIPSRRHTRPFHFLPQGSFDIITGQ
jgi:hypothetical protein